MNNIFAFLKKIFSTSDIASANQVFLYDSMSKEKVLFSPIQKNEVKIYSCGPTVYKPQHIGNMRAFVFADTLHRVMQLAGYNVKHVINITDVGHLTDDADDGEDKLEKTAKESNKSASAIAKEISEKFLNDLDLLNINLKEYQFPRATGYISAQIELIQDLEKKNYTYRTQDGIYFDTSKFPNYGSLGNIDISNLKDGARIGKKDSKRNLTDFALWKFSKPGEHRQQEWDSPWGVGFPGWHIECSAMSMSILGKQIDIHTGGVEHIPVHHNNEIAQSECATGISPFVKYWMHGQHLKVDGEKMSKSLGNVIYLSDITKKGYTAADFRYLLLTAHYRSEINFTWGALDASKTALSKLTDYIATENERGHIIANYESAFKKALFNDLNTSKAIAVIWEVMKSDYNKKDKISTIRNMLDILGVDFKSKIKHIQIPENIERLLRLRDKVRREKKWEESDKLREEINKMGYRVLDTKDGQKVEKL